MPFSSLRRAPARRPVSRASSGIVLGIILACYLMIVVDLSVIITALPDIRTSLGFTTAGLSWVQNAYALTFGGLLLLGARAGDILGRRRVFMAGVALFSAASLVAGLAQSSSWLLIARAVQGVGAAVAAPSTLALLTTTFREGAERTRALAYYSAVAGGGGSVGLVLGGLLTDLVSWRWGLFINVPIGLVLLALAPRYLEETERNPGRFDLPGAAASTIGVTALVYGFVRAASDGWGAPATVAAFAAGIVLLVGFVANERRAEQPITPLRLFASRERSGAYLTRMLVVGGMFSMFFFLTQFLQGVLGFNPLQAGLAFLPMSVVLFAVSQAVPRLARDVSPLRVLIGGLVVALAGMAWLSRLSDGSAFFPDVAMPLVLIGIGIGLALVPLTASGIAGVAPGDAGAASGLVNVSQQIGASLGLGILVTVFAGAHDLAGGIASAVSGAAVFLALGLVVALTVMRRPAPAAGIAVAVDEAPPHREAGPASGHERRTHRGPARPRPVARR